MRPGSERRIAAANFRKWSISRFLMRRIGGTDSIEARIMKRAAVERSRSGPRQPRKRRPDQRAQDGVDGGASAAGFFRRLQFVEPLAVGGEAAGDEQFGDQFVLGAEMIVHRRQIDIRRGDDVAQRDIAKAAIGIKPFGGVKDRGSGLVCRHGHGPMQAGELQFKQLYETMV